MQRARFEIFGLALLALGLGSGCSSDGEKTEEDVAAIDGGGANGTANEGSNANGGDAGDNNGSSANNGNNDPVDSGMKDSGPPDSGMCTPMYNGCDDKYPEADPTTLCGRIDNGCGVMIDCDPEEDNCPGFEGACNDPAKPNRCGCLPKTCADVVAGGAKCGDDIDDGCGGTITGGCGSCPGAQEVCTSKYQCECAPDLQACAGKLCGTRPNGCGVDIPCGPEAGGCAAGDCSADQTACICPTQAESCAGKTGPLMLPNGCAYDCDLTCLPSDNLAACAGAECGTAVNKCGDTVKCGSNDGACAAGEACVASTYITGDPLPLQAGTYLGGLCIDNDVANLIGKYGVRTHAFRKGGSENGSSESRAQALSLVTITADATGATVHMRDEGCSATSINFPGTTPATSIAPAYAKLPAVEIDLTVTGNAAGTGTWKRAVVAQGAGEPTGFTPGMPPYCNGREGKLVDLPLGDARSWFTNGQCRCPIAALANALPASSAGAINQDCRINDVDQDGKPGFTVNATVSFLLTAEAYSASYAQVAWEGSVVPSGYHVARAKEKNPVQRATVGCTGISPALCTNAAGFAEGSYDCPCGTDGEFNFIQFSPLVDLDDPNKDGWTCSEIVSEEVRLFTRFGACATQNDCPAQTLCTGGFCRPATSDQACAGNRNACPQGMRCAGANACWPNLSECPAAADSPNDSCKISGTCTPETVAADCMPWEVCGEQGRCKVPGNCSPATVGTDCAIGESCDESVTPNRCKAP